MRRKYAGESLDEPFLGDTLIGVSFLVDYSTSLNHRQVEQGVIS